jgi:hypothetical protein
MLGEWLDRTEHCLVGVLGSPELFGALAVVAARGTDAARLDAAKRRVARFVERAVAEHVERRTAIGLAPATRPSRLESAVRDAVGVSH